VWTIALLIVGTGAGIGGILFGSCFATLHPLDQWHVAIRVLALALATSLLTAGLFVSASILRRLRKR